ELAGTALPEDFTPDGQSMVDALLGKEVERSTPIFWEWRGGASGDNWPQLAIRDGKWKLLMT
ncbi:MAG: N-acetylgalactosamine 6-sulfate sulfatase (GALNS), partial [Akkermansiaceae bacterium]|nr:N-acetylgalactosamine 6-sulfate sulfatase (GALNS) [Akkermansiaceae bacterium]